MVDVGGKSVTAREAVALGEVRLSPEVLSLLREGKTAKGDALACARLAGILAAKKVPELIPLCHSIRLDSVEVSFLFKSDGILIRSRARAEGKTGVEMEALTAVSVAALTLYDMCKSADKGIVMGPIYLARKTGGKSDYEKTGIETESGQWL